MEPEMEPETEPETEPESHLIPTSTFASELLPSYPSSSVAKCHFPTKGNYTEHTTVAIVTSQVEIKMLFTTGKTGADNVVVLSVCLCVFCFLFGSPLALLCLVPAILIAREVKYYCTVVYNTPLHVKCRGENMQQMENMIKLKKQLSLHWC